MWFASAYVDVRVMGLALQLDATLGTEFWIATRMCVGFSAVGLVAVLTGGLVESPFRELAMVCRHHHRRAQRIPKSISKRVDWWGSGWARSCTWVA